MMASFEMAINRIEFGRSAVFVGAPGQVSFRSLVTSGKNEEVLQSRLDQIWRMPGLDRARYAAALRPVINNENSTSIFIEFFARIAPWLTVSGLGMVLGVARTICIAIFVFEFLRVGGSILQAGLLATVAIAIGDAVSQTHTYSCYANVLPCMLLCTAALSRSTWGILDAQSRLRGAVGWGVLFGLLSAVTWNVRTSAAPIVLALAIWAVLTVTLVWWRRARTGVLQRIGIKLAAFLCLSFLTAVTTHFSIVHYTLDRSVDSAAINYTYHAVWHPIVLGLAVPPTEFSAARGIRWNDAVGIALAREIVPDAVYLGKEYESALKTYYFKLWTRWPKEMALLYVEKFRMVGLDVPMNGCWKSGWSMTSFARPVVAILTAWVLVVKSGTVVILTEVMIGVACLLLILRASMNVQLISIAAGLVILAILSQIESALVIPMFHVTHFPLEAFGLAFMGSLFLQIVIIMASRAIDAFKMKIWGIAHGSGEWGLVECPVNAQASLAPPETRPAGSILLPVEPLDAIPSRDQISLSVVAPVYNEQLVIREFVRRVLVVLRGMGLRDFELVLVNDGSRDGSLAVLRELTLEEPAVRVIDLRRNYGQTAALQCGIDAARHEVVVTMDSDLQHFPEEIPAFLTKILLGFDIVCGWRSERVEGIVRRWPSRIANLFIHWITGLEIHDFGTTFRAYRSEIAKDIRLYGEFHRFVPVMGHIVGARIAELPIRNIERPHGKSSYGLSRTIGVALDLVIVNFFVKYMDRPMRFFGFIGGVMLIAGGAILSVLFAASFVYGVSMVRERVGWFVLAALLLLGALQAIFTGILAEVLIRIRFEQGNDRVYKIRSVYSRERA